MINFTETLALKGCYFINNILCLNECERNPREESARAMYYYKYKCQLIKWTHTVKSAERNANEKNPLLLPPLKTIRCKK